MSGYVPRRVLNARISTTIEKNQTPMQAGLAPRVGKSGASIRLYYQRVDGCECNTICDPYNAPVVIQKRYLIPGALRESSNYLNSAGVFISDSNASVATSINPSQWAWAAGTSVSNYTDNGDQSDRIYYAIVLSRDVNPVVGNITPTLPLRLGYRKFRDNNLNVVFPGGPGSNYNVPGTTDGQFTYNGPPQSGGGSETVFRPISYGATGAMSYGTNGFQTIPASDYTIVGPSSSIAWDVNGIYKGNKLETDRQIFGTGINSGWRIDLSGTSLDNFPGVRKWSGPGQSHWGPVNDPTYNGIVNRQVHNPNHVSADTVFIVHNPVHFGGYALLFNISQAILESSDINGMATAYNPTVGLHANCWGYLVGNIPAAIYNGNDDYSAEYPGESAVIQDGRGHGPLEIWHSSTSKTSWGILNGGITTSATPSKENDPWMALHWFVYHNGISTFYDPRGSFKLQTSNNIRDNCTKYDDVPDEPGDFLPNAGVAGFRLRAIAPDKDPPNLEWWYQQI